jgi:hypothetical protein
MVEPPDPVRGSRRRQCDSGGPPRPRLLRAPGGIRSRTRSRGTPLRHGDRDALPRRHAGDTTSSSDGGDPADVPPRPCTLQRGPHPPPPKTRTWPLPAAEPPTRTLFNLALTPPSRGWARRSCSFRRDRIDRPAEPPGHTGHVPYRPDKANAQVLKSARETRQIQPGRPPSPAGRSTGSSATPSRATSPVSARAGSSRSPRPAARRCDPPEGSAGGPG